MITRLSSGRDILVWFEGCDPNGEVASAKPQKRESVIRELIQFALEEYQPRPDEDDEFYPLDWNGDRLDEDRAVSMVDEFHP